MLTRLAGPSKGLVRIARREGYLPPFLQKVNEEGVPVNILVTQGALTTVIGLLHTLVPTVSSAYWILSVMTTQVYLIMYVLMFNSARRLRRKKPEVKRGFAAPRLTLLCIVGAASSLAAFVIGFVPPSQAYQDKMNELKLRHHDLQRVPRAARDPRKRAATESRLSSSERAGRPQPRRLHGG